MADLDRFSLFTETRERLGRALVRSVSAALAECAEVLEDASERAATASGRRESIAAASVLVVENEVRATRALGRLYDLTFRLLELNQSAVADGDGEPMLLALLGDDELDHQILVDALAGAVRERLGERYERAQRRIDALTRTPAVDARAPLGAGVLAAAALEPFRPYTAAPATRGALREAALQRLAPRLADAIDEIDAWLASQGIEPWLPAPTAPEPTVEVPPQRAIGTPSEPVGTDDHVRTADFAPAPGAAPEPEPVPGPAPEPEPRASPTAGYEPDDSPGAAVAGAPDATRGSTPRDDSDTDSGPQVGAEPAASTGSERVVVQVPASALADGVAASEAPMEHAAEALVHATQVADVLGRQPFAVGRPESAYRHAGALPRPEALERDGVAFAHHVGVAPYTRAARQRFFEGLRGRMLAAQAPAAQLAALDLVAALFDYVVDDARMPAAAQPLLWRLQQPVATLAALDAGFLGDDRRSVRRLVENLTAISIAYADDVTQGSELYRRLDTVVRAVEVVAHAFQARSSVLGEQVRREYERAAHGVAQLVSRVAKERTALESTPGRRNRRDYARRPSRERELEVTRRLEAELRGRLERCEVPESVRDFLLGVWLRHLRTALLRDGEDSAQFKLAIQVVDDLLWSLDTSGPRQSRRELAGRIPPLIRLLTQGVSDIGARPEEFRPFLDELFLIHLRKMQRVPRDADTEPRPGRRPDDGVPSGLGPRPRPVPEGDEQDRDAPTLDERLSEPPSSSDEDAQALVRVPTLPLPLPLPLRPEADRTTGVGLPLGAPAVEPATRAAQGASRPDAPDDVAAGDSSPVEAPGSRDAAGGPRVGPAAATGDTPVPAHGAGRDSPPGERPVTPSAAANHRGAEPAPPPMQAPGSPPGSDPPGESDPAGASGPAPGPRAGGAAASGAPADLDAPRTVPPRRPIMPPGPPDEGRSGDQRLLSVLSSLDLGDFPDAPQRLRMDPDEALARLRRGDWLELIGRDGLPQEVKVAWINSRRTVVLLVRRPDRRALSLRAAELHQRFADHKAALIV